MLLFPDLDLAEIMGRRQSLAYFEISFGQARLVSGRHLVIASAVRIRDQLIMERPSLLGTLTHLLQLI